MRRWCRSVIDEHGRIDLFCSNAGITTGVALDDPDDLWHIGYEINVMAHVYAARAVIPHMLENGGGYLLNTASAAGLLDLARRRGVRRHQARRGRVRGMAVDHVRRLAASG